MTGTLLVVEDDAALRDYLTQALRADRWVVEATGDPTAAPALVAACEPDVVLVDLHLEGGSGLELCAGLVAERPDVPVVVMTAFGTLDSAVAAIRAGAYDFLTKPFELEELQIALARARERAALRREVRRLRRAVDGAQGYGEILGASEPIARLRGLLERVAPSNAPVLVTGASGTGKELVARAIHRGSRRAAAPFVAVNCAAIPETLLESELFGHVRGAFTDARAGRAGLFVQASGGTILLDEVAELPLALQPKLLRVLQDRAVRPLGSDVEVTCDVRLVAATNRNLEDEVRAGRFREDLFFRLAVLHVHVPPLRDRGSDVLLLARRFLAEAAHELGGEARDLSPEAAERLLAYDWPGNVRELQNAMQHAAALAQHAAVGVGDLPPRVTGGRAAGEPGAAPVPASELAPLADVERRHVLRVLAAVGGNKTLAARTLGIDRKTLLRKLGQLAGDPPAE